MMSNTNETSLQAVVVTTVAAAPAPALVTKDAGRVKIGGGSISFLDVKDAGRVKIGGGSLSF